MSGRNGHSDIAKLLLRFPNQEQKEEDPQNPYRREESRHHSASLEFVRWIWCSRSQSGHYCTCSPNCAR